MNLKRKIIVVAMILVSICMMVNTISFAVTATPSKYFGVKPAREPGVDGRYSAYKYNGAAIFSIFEYNDSSKTAYNYDNTIYCLNAVQGFVEENGELTSEAREYNSYYNMKTEKDIIPVANLSLKSTQYYNNVLWILDHMYVPDKQTSTMDREILLKRSGILTDTITTSPLTDDDIEAVQQAAIWYYTNSDSSIYKPETDELPELQVGTTTDKTANINDITFIGLTDIDRYRQEDAEKLYKYLITQAEANKAQYDITLDLPVPLEITGTRTAVIENGKLVVGPFTITQKSTLPYNLTLLVNNGTTYGLLDNDKNDLTVKTTNDLVGKTFYITLDDTTLTNINVKFGGIYTKTTANFWTNANSTVEQPLVIIDKTPQEINVPFEIVITPKEEPIFDLALRKAIVKIENQDVIDRYAKRENGNKTLYNYYDIYNNKPLVEHGDLVTYSIRIYNEGEADGYASLIKDALPTGLEFYSSTYNGIDYGWTKVDGTTNTYQTDYLSKEKEISAGANLIHAFIGEEGDTTTEAEYKEIFIVCRVVDNIKGNTNIDLVNVAEIAVTTDKDGVNNSNKDIDSVPNNGAGNVSNWKNEDDLDIEILRLKKFDLALRKFITAINDKTVTTRIPQVDITNLAVGDSTTATYTHPKDPILLSTGDFVTYTFRIYNEGEVDGYVKEIEDRIPEGLEFVWYDEVSEKIISNTGAEYETSSVSEELLNRIKDINGNWTLNEDASSMKTDYLSEENGKKIMLAERLDENPNLINAFDATKPVSDTEGEKNPDYKDIQVILKVTETDSSKILTNTAEITKHTDSKGNEDILDRDSIPDNDISSEDDIDIEKVRVQQFDLALRKFVSAVNGEALDISREPVTDVTNLNKEVDGEIVKTAEYNHTKKPLGVNVNNEIIYTIRVYNEADIDGYASVITDHLPEYLDFVDDEFNKDFGWQVSEDGRTVTTSYLASDGKIIKAYDGNLSYQDVQIKCKVNENVIVHTYLTNMAEISEYRDANKNVVNPDRDSTSNNLENILGNNLNSPEYKNDEISSGKTYISGQEDDDDFEKIYVQIFDLSLRKFITGVNDSEITTRVPVVTKGEDGKLTYTHPKDPVDVRTDDLVVYTIRVYNEGDISGYASEVTDNVPKGLEFYSSQFGEVDYGWKMYRLFEDGESTDGIEVKEYAGKKYVETDDKTKAAIITTDYLSKENEETTGENLLKPFDMTADVSEANPDYRDLKVVFKVIEPNTSDRIVINIAEISKDTDEGGKEIEDIDSVPGNGVAEEDDIDEEKIKVKYYDLSLIKYVTKVITIENGKETIRETGYNGFENPEPVVKVDLNRKKLNEVTVKFAYAIEVFNEGEIEGHAMELTDYVPDGLKFVQEDNPDWTVSEDGKVIKTEKLANTLLKPGESAKVEVILTWINDKENMGQKTNTAEISKDDGDDIDSTPDNKVPGEDDIDEAIVILSIITGQARIYLTLGLIVLVTVAAGVVLIKKYVL